MNWILNLDLSILQSINSLAGKWYALDLFGIICAKYLIFVIAGAVLGWWVSMHRTRPSHSWPVEGKKKWLILGNLSLAVLFSYGVSQLLALIKFRTRPFISFNLKQFVNPLSEKSFPSDHTTVAFAAAMVVYFYNKKLGIILLSLALLIGLARIYVGVHYPLDILGGIILGILSAGIFYLVFNYRKKKENR